MNTRVVSLVMGLSLVPALAATQSVLPKIIQSSQNGGGSTNDANTAASSRPADQKCLSEIGETKSDTACRQTESKSGINRKVLLPPILYFKEKNRAMREMGYHPYNDTIGPDLKLSDFYNEYGITNRCQSEEIAEGKTQWSQTHRIKGLTKKVAEMAQKWANGNYIGVIQKLGTFFDHSRNGTDKEVSILPWDPIPIPDPLPLFPIWPQFSRSTLSNPSLEPRLSHSRQPVPSPEPGNPWANHPDLRDSRVSMTDADPGIVDPGNWKPQPKIPQPGDPNSPDPGPIATLSSRKPSIPTPEPIPSPFPQPIPMPDPSDPNPIGPPLTKLTLSAPAWEPRSSLFQQSVPSPEPGVLPPNDPDPNFPHDPRVSMSSPKPMPYPQPKPSPPSIPDTAILCDHCKS